MAILNDYIFPIVFVTFSLVFTGFFCVGVYFLFRRVLPKDFGLWLKYHLLRKNYSEKDVKWCLMTYELKASTEDIERFLKIKGYSKGRIKNTLFIYRELIKVKGGNAETYGKQIQQSSLQTFKGRGGEEVIKEKEKS